jgi:hypothetical protein
MPHSTTPHLRKETMKRKFDRVSEDGKYGLKGHYLHLIMEDGSSEEVVGALMDVENFYTAIDNFEEEMRYMLDMDIRE